MQGLLYYVRIICEALASDTFRDYRTFSIIVRIPIFMYTSRASDTEVIFF